MSTGKQIERQPITTFLVGNELSEAQKPQEAPAGLTKRLDSLDKDLKELRKLVEQLQKSATTIIERQRSSADSPKD